MGKLRNASEINLGTKIAHSFCSTLFLVSAHLRTQPLNLPNFNYKTHLITVSILRPAWQLPLPCSQSPAAVRDKWWSNGAVKREADQRANINGTQSGRPRSYNKQPKGEGAVMSCGALELPNGSLWPQHSHSNTPPLTFPLPVQLTELRCQITAPNSMQCFLGVQIVGHADDSMMPIIT